MRAETMIWAGPLPEEIDAVAELMWDGATTSADPAPGTSARESAGALRIAIVWAGPLPPVDVPVQFAFRDSRRQLRAFAP
jgi:hypothetical protein